MATVTTTAAVAEHAPPRIESGYRRMWQIAWPVAVSTSIVSLFSVANCSGLATSAPMPSPRCRCAGTSSSSPSASPRWCSSARSRSLRAALVRVGATRRTSPRVHAVILGSVLGASLAAIGWLTAPSVVALLRRDRSGRSTRHSVPADHIGGAVPVLHVDGNRRIVFRHGRHAHADDPERDRGGHQRPHRSVPHLRAWGAFVGGLDIGWLGWGVDGAAISDVVSGFGGRVIFVTVSIDAGSPVPRPRGERLALQPETSVADRPHRHPGERVIGRAAAVDLPADSRDRLIRHGRVGGVRHRLALVLDQLDSVLRRERRPCPHWSGRTSARATSVRPSVSSHAESAWRRPGRGILSPLRMVCVDRSSRSSIPIRRHRHRVPFVQLVAFGFLATGTTVPLVAAMNGAGDTRPSMIVTFLANWPVKLPLCWALAIPFGYGTNGVWTGMLVSMLVEAAIIAWWFRRGTWKTRRI